MRIGANEIVVREIFLEASPETVFAFFVDADKLTRWLAIDATVEGRAGGRCIQVHEGCDRDGGPYHMHGTFLAVEPPKRVVFTWGFTSPDVGVPPGSSVVEVTLLPSGSGTAVRLVHRDLPAAEIENHRAGWAEMLERLAAAVTSTKEKA